MIVHLDEVRLAREHAQDRAFEALDAGQSRAILDRGRALHRWFKAHRALHALINAAAILSIFAADWLALWYVPALFISSQRSPGLLALVAAGLITGVLESWLLYSLAIFSLHEGSAHRIIFPGSGRISRVAQFLASNMCRLAGGDPEYYSACHMAHHARFGTEQDSEFLNFVLPRRFWLTLLPLGAFLNFSDFVIHRPLRYTISRVVSEISVVIYVAAHAFIAYRAYGPVLTLALLAVLPHVGFYTDRLRQFTEHNLMPLENASGSRSFGCGFWGIVVGGGPWGQPCHMAHHLVPSIPWYQQLILHRYMKGLLTAQQRRQFLLRPVIGFPLLLWTIVRDANHFCNGRLTEQEGLLRRATSMRG